MSIALLLPAVFGLLLIAVVIAPLGALGWPRLGFRTYNKAIGRLRVFEIALILGPSDAKRLAGEKAPAPLGQSRAELTVYITLKRCNP